jgi:CubicO group peptidase (beta-lactamase class C family)
LILLTLLGWGEVSCTEQDVRSGARPAQIRAETDWQWSVADLVAPLIEDEWVVGLSIALIDRDRVEYLHHGRVSLASEAVPDRDTVYEVGSLSKVFTGLLLAEMVHAELVGLDQPAQQLLPAGVHMPERSGRQIALRHLSTHTSGLPRLPDNMPVSDPADPYADYRAEHLYAFLDTHRLRRDPGVAFEYSNLGTGLLGHLLGLRLGADHYTALRQRVLLPLAMTSTDTTPSPELAGRLAQGHDADARPAAPWRFDVLAAAGGLRSTMRDMVRFAQANLAPDGSGIGPALRLARQRHGDAPGFHGIGLGWFLIDERNIFHNGQTGGFHGFMQLDPAETRGVVVLANSASEVVDQLGTALYQLVHGHTPAPLALPETVSVAPEVLDRLAGEYGHDGASVLTVFRSGDRLLLRATDLPVMRLWPSSETEFYLRAIAATVRFAGDGSRMTVEQAGTVQEFSRLR